MNLRITWLQPHHLYAGILLMALAFWIGGNLGGMIFLIGLYLAIDDLYQHWRQVKQPDYQSPIHRLFVWLWDRTFGKFINWPLWLQK